MLYLICFGLFLPLVGFLSLLVFSSKVNRQWAGLIACSTLFISFLCFVSLFYIHSTAGMLPANFTLFEWIPFGSVQTNFSLHLDTLALLMTLIITGVGFLIHVYSIGYMDHEKDFARFFACLNFFVFSMLLLVLAGNLLLLFAGWEGVGLASYLLIGFWYTRPAAAQAATKAFIVNRIGDLGLLLGLLLTFYTFGTSDIAEVNARVKQEFAIGAPVLMLLSLLYFIGAAGKSAQIPLHVWLPDAMEGPTPVSALIHAATMVTAGVYLVVRMNPVFLHSPQVLSLVGYIGGATSLFAALCAVGQTDLKRVLAYSTVSQLGLMFLACGVGAFYAAMFHLTSHAFIKALLFLSAGNVVHMMHGTTEMEKMGGLSKTFTKTNLLFLIGVLALSGIPPFAAFFSKDLIIEEGCLSGSAVLCLMGLAVSILTAFYLTRAYCLAFAGKSNLDESARKTVKEAPWIMIAPVSILALLSIFGGLLGYSHGKPPPLEHFLTESAPAFASAETATGFHFTQLMVLSTIFALLGVGAAAYLYIRLADRTRTVAIPFLKKSFYIDELYDKIIVQPFKLLSQVVVAFFEPIVFDGPIRGTVHATQATSHALQKFQSGQIRSYVAWMVVGMAFLIVYLTF